MSAWWVPVLIGIVAGLALFLFVEQALRAPWRSTRHRDCREHAPIGWRCMRPHGHGGGCLPIRSDFGLRWDRVRRRLRLPLERWRMSHDRCTLCGRREARPGACGCVPF